MFRVGFGDLTFWTDYNTFRTLTSGRKPLVCVYGKVKICKT